MRCAGTPDVACLVGPRGSVPDSVLADAALVVQQLTGVATEPVLVSPDGVAKMGREAGLLVVGISNQWRVEGLPPIHSEIVHALPVHVLSCGAGRALGSSPGPRSDVSFLARHRDRHRNVHEGARVSLGHRPHARELHKRSGELGPN
jgi:hypothetical protein